MTALLDVCCGAGAAAEGYHRAGFDVIVGVDSEPQPRYPFTFVQADALEYLAGADLSPFAAIHASPPCLRYTSLRHMPNARHDHPDLVGPVRDLLAATGLPYVIENVPGSPVAPLVMLCGSSFGLGIPGYQLRRHRWFETCGFWPLSLPCQHSGPVIGVYGEHGKDRRRPGGYARYFTLAERSAAMGVDWMTSDELNQAIPPAYTQYLGEELLAFCQQLPGAAVGGAVGGRDPVGVLKRH